jgi:MHS family citrate/tricarballylate:H+ symporter-like MFS transporter
VATYLIHVTDNRAVAGVWLMFAAACGLVATLLAFRTSSALKSKSEAAGRSTEPAR